MVMVLLWEKLIKKSDIRESNSIQAKPFQQSELIHQMLKNHRPILIFLKKTESMVFLVIETVQ